MYTLQLHTIQHTDYYLYKFSGPSSMVSVVMRSAPQTSVYSLLTHKDGIDMLCVNVGNYVAVYAV